MTAGPLGGDAPEAHAPAGGRPRTRRRRRETTDPRRERDVKREVLLELSRRGALAWNNPVGVFVPLSCLPGWDGPRVRIGQTGAADVLSVLEGGMPLAVETKHPVTGRLRQVQRLWRDAWEKRGGVYVVARSVEDLP